MGNYQEYIERYKYLHSFFSLGARWGWVVNATPQPLYPLERPGTHCIGGWVGPRAVLDGWGKSRLPPGFDPCTVQPLARPYTNCADVGHGQVADCCKYGNELSVSTECDDCLVCGWGISQTDISCSIKTLLYGYIQSFCTKPSDLNNFAFKPLRCPFRLLFWTWIMAPSWLPINFQNRL